MQNYETTNNNTEKLLSEIMMIAGIMPNLKGYKYLKDAIKSVVKSPRLATEITKKLYPIIAEQNETSPQKVERAIRNAINVGYEAGKMSNLNSYFSADIFTKYQRPTNSELIAVIADRLMFCF